MRRTIRKWMQWTWTVAIFIQPMAVQAAGGAVQYPDGTPASGAKVIVNQRGQGETVVVCDAQGRFELISVPAEHAFVRVCSQRKDYAQVRVPAGLFQGDDVAIVLPRKQEGE